MGKLERVEIIQYAGIHREIPVLGLERISKQGATRYDVFVRGQNYGIGIPHEGSTGPETIIRCDVRRGKLRVIDKPPKR